MHQQPWQPDSQPVPPHVTDPGQQRPLLPPGASAYSRPSKPPPAPWQRRQRLGTWLIVGGVLSVAAGLLIEYGWYNKPVSQINGLCSSALGQLAQAGSGTAASNCSTAALLDHVLGWLIIAGVLAIIAGVAAGLSARHLRAGVAVPPQPAAPGIGGAVPSPPGPQPPGGTYPYPPSPPSS
jgi:hypothetical protein